MEVGGSIRVEEAGFGNENRQRVEYRGQKEVTQDGVVFGVSLDREAMEGKLWISGGESEGHPGVVADREELIELVGESIEEGGVGGSRDGGVDNSEGDRTMFIDKSFEADGEAGISFPQDGGGQVGPTDTDKVAFGMGGRYVPGGVESPCGTGEGRRTLG